MYFVWAPHHCIYLHRYATLDILCAIGVDTDLPACLQYAGIIISPIAILFMVYALFMYKRRTIQILRRSKVRFDDQQGPVMLVVLLIAAVLASLVLTAYGTLK